MSQITTKYFLTLGELFQRYIREEIPNMSVEDLVKYVNITLQLWDENLLAEPQIKYFHADNETSEIDLSVTPYQGNGYILHLSGVVNSPDKTLIKLLDIINPSGYKMRESKGISYFQDKGNNYFYEHVDDKIKVYQTFSPLYYPFNGNFGVTSTYIRFPIYPTSLTDYVNDYIPDGMGVGQKLFVTGYMKNIDGDIHEHWYDYLKITSFDIIEYTGQYWLIANVSSANDDAILDFSGTYAEVYPLYGVYGIYETTKVVLDSNPFLQALDINNIDLFITMLFIELFSSNKYKNLEMLSLYKSRLNSYDSKRIL